MTKFKVGDRVIIKTFNLHHIFIVFNVEDIVIRVFSSSKLGYYFFYVAYEEIIKIEGT